MSSNSQCRLSPTDIHLLALKAEKTGNETLETSIAMMDESSTQGCESEKHVDIDSSTLSSYPEMLTVEQVSGLLQMHVNTVRKLLKSNEIPGKKFGHEWRVPKDALI